jgi:SAM-dependent methyltransferase
LKYDAEYYKSHCGETPYDRSQPYWLSFFGHIADEIVRAFRPKKVLDVGCAKGFLVECLRDRGVEAFGFDISEYAIGEVRPDIRPYCWVASINDPISDYYDLVVNIEVLEHVSETEAVEAIANMAGHTSHILFSSSPIDFSEPTHQNVRSILWWLRAFAKESFAPDLIFNADFVITWAFLVQKTDQHIPDDQLVLFAQYLDLKLRVQRIEQDLAQRNSLVEQQRQRIAESSNARDLLQSELFQKTAECDQLQSELANRTAEFDALRESLTWRLTSPFRAIGRRIPGLKAGLQSFLK